MGLKLLSICGFIRTWGFRLLVLVTPLIMTTSTREIFEFPKMLFVYLLTLIIVSVRAVELTITGRVYRKINYFTWPAAIFLAGYFLSTLFSLDYYTSLTGYYTRFNGGLISVLCFFLLFLILSSTATARESKNLLRLVLISALPVSLYAVAQHFGADRSFWVQDSQARAFSTFGQPNWLAAYLVLVWPLSLALLARGGKEKKALLDLGQGPAHPGVLFLLPLLIFLALWFTYSLSGLLGFATAVSVFLFLAGRDFFRANRRFFLMLSAGMFLVAATQPGIFRSRWESLWRQVDRVVPKATALEIAPAPAGYEGDTADIRLIVWRGALKLFISDPKITLLGTGPETFAYAFLPFRPTGMNKTSEWDFLYNKAHNDYIETLVTRGLFGLLSLLLMVVSYSHWTKKTLAKLSAGSFRLVLVALFAGWAGLLVTNIFGWPVVMTSLLFWFYPALAFTLVKEK